MESKTLLDLAYEASDAMLRLGRTLHSMGHSPSRDHMADRVYGASAEVVACTALLAGASRDAPESLRDSIAALGRLRETPADESTGEEPLRRLVEETAAYVHEIPDGEALSGLVQIVGCSPNDLCGWSDSR